MSGAVAVVTGGSGFIGAALVSHLDASGWRVVSVDRNPPAHRSVEHVQTDVATPGALRELLPAGAIVFHLAASADVARSVREPRHDLANTFAGLFEVLEAAREQGCRVIFPSTASVFDVGQPLPLGERSLTRPTSPYGAAKLAGEAYCYAYHRSFGTDVRVARLFSVYGPGMRRLAIHDLIQKIHQGDGEISILGDGEQVRDYLYIDDAVRALVTVATAGRAGEDYNVASGEPVRLRDLAAELGRLMGHPSLRIVPTGQSFPGDTPRWYGDVAKLRGLGFRAEVPLVEGLRRTIASIVPEPRAHVEAAR